MSEFLVFQLYGPMASWGDVAVGEYRPTMNYPSKSAVLGLVAAALGVRRHEDDKHQALHNGYGFSVCVLGSGELLRDYHTTQVPKGNISYATRRDELCYDPLKLSTILSQRDYRMDSLCLIALWEKEMPSFSLEQLQTSLLKPHYTLYLGRKSCPPALPLNPQVIKAKTLKLAFTKYTGDEVVSNARQLRDELPGFFWEQDGIGESELGFEAVMKYPRRDQILNRSRWQFTTRDEYFCMESMKGEE